MKYLISFFSGALIVVLVVSVAHGTFGSEYRGQAITTAYEECKNHGGVLRAYISMTGDYLIANCADLTRVVSER